MKKIMVACLAFLVSVSAFAATAYMDTVSRRVSWTRPDVATNPYTNQEFRNPSDGTLADCGFVLVEYEDCDFKYRLCGWEPSPWCRAMDAGERQVVDDAAAATQAEAEAHANDPVRFDNGIVSGNGFVYIPSTPGGSNGWVVAVTTNGDLLTSHWYGSPTSTVSEIVSDLTNRAARLQKKKNAAKAAKAQGNGTPALQARIAALEALLGVE